MNGKSGIMRFLYVILLLVLHIAVFGQSLPDEVVIDYASLNKPLGTVLRELAQKSNVNINFSEKRIPSNKKISISVTNETVGDILTVILRDIGYSYDIIGDQLVIIKDNARGEEQFFTISGYLKDKVSGENLVYANVYLYDKTKGTQSNADGFYSITLSRGTQRIYFSYIGYQQAVREHFLVKDVEETIFLKPDVQLNEVVILEDVENREEETTSSESNLYITQIQTATTLGGESDIVRLINMAPGVNSGADGLGGMNIRGGSADQNLVLLDGTPIYNSGHALGLFSIFNSDVIKNAKLLKGNIPARYGGRLSSVLDVKTRDGNVNKTSGSASLSLFAIKGVLEGPIGSNGSSYLVSARRTYLDLWLKKLTRARNSGGGKDGFSTYFFADFNAKLKLVLNKRNSLLISGFLARDEFSNFRTEEIPFSAGTSLEKSGFNWDWGNNTLSIRLKTQLSKKAFSTLSTYYTDYSFESFDYDSFLNQVENDSIFVYTASLFNSAIQDVNLKYAIDYLPNTQHRIRAGLGYTHHSFSPGLTSVGTDSGLFTQDSDITASTVRSLARNPNLSGSEIEGYVEDEISFSYSTKLNIGLHTNLTSTDSKNYISIQPRLALLTQGENMYFKMGLSRMSQYLHLLSSNGLGFPSDVWLPSTDQLAPEKSWIFSAGLGYKNKKGIQWGVEGYYKIYDDITSFNEGETNNIDFGGPNWENKVPVGKGNSYGVEFYFNKIIGRTTWNANYTLSWATLQFADLNLSNPFPFGYDRRHNVKLGFFHKVTDNTEFVLNWTISSGNPVTFPENVAIDNGKLIIFYGAKNNERLSSYHRLDFAFNFYSKLKWARQKFSLGVYNAFDRRNEFYKNITIDPDGGFVQNSFSIFPIIPSITYTLSF